MLVMMIFRGAVKGWTTIIRLVLHMMCIMHHEQQNKGRRGPCRVVGGGGWGAGAVEGGVGREGG